MSIKTATLNGVATIEIARPEKKNALTLAMYQAMADAIDAARADPAVRALLITGQPGTTMLLHCDLVYAGDNAMFSLPFVNLGLCPEAGSSLLLPQRIGMARAAEKLLLGDPFSGADAVELGLANAVLPAGEVLPHARRVAERFNALPPGAVRESKRLLRAPQQQAIVDTIQSEGELFAARLRSPEAKEAFQAFFQKRRPDFTKF